MRNCIYVFKWITIIIFVFFITCSFAQGNDVVLSNVGSSRATAYTFSNKIIETSDKIYTLTVDFINKKYSLVLRETGKKSSLNTNEYILDQSLKDNHGGGAMVIDSRGYIHIVYGPHNGPFSYIKSSLPFSGAKFSEIQKFGSKLTYPSLTIDNNDNLYLVGRQSASNDKWKILFFVKKRNLAWSNGTELLLPNYEPWGNKVKTKQNQIFNPYINTSSSIIIDNEGIMHFCFRMFQYVPKNVKSSFLDKRHAVSYMVGYAYSSDYGKSWYANNRKLQLPISPNRAEKIIGGNKPENADGFYDITNITLDNKNNPIIGISSIENEKTRFWFAKRENSIWKIASVNLKDKYIFSPAVISYYQGSITLASVSIKKTLYHRDRTWGYKDNHLEIMKVIWNNGNLSIQSIFSGTNATWFPSISIGTKYAPVVMYMEGHAASENNKIHLYK